MAKRFVFSTENGHDMESGKSYLALRVCALNVAIKMVSMKLDEDGMLSGGYLSAALRLMAEEVDKLEALK